MLTQDDARRIADKLGMHIRQGRRHELAVLVYNGKQITQFGISRSSKQQSHDYVSKQLYITHGQCRELHGCPLTKDQYLDILKSKNLLPS